MKKSLNEEIARMKTMMNVMGETVTDTKVICDNCGWGWKKNEGGNDLYICHKCGHDNAPSLNEDTFSGTHVWNHIKSITPNQDDIPWGFSKKIKNAEFVNVSNFNLYSLLETDPDFKEYYESGDERYSDDEVDPSDIDNEIVVVNGELLDGYSRAATLLRSGAKTTNAFVGKVDGYEREPLDEYIRKIGDNKWRVYSEKGKNLGTYDSESGAKKRLQQVHYFKSL